MDRIPPIARRSRWEPPLPPTALEAVERRRREQAADRKRSPRPSEPVEEPASEDGDDGPHIDTRA